ncbi:zinc-binding dehydrogenase [Gordonia rubripertincta]|uniref:Zinc-binding dehydrogenase n=1 Tax=Gordonia rubripertincta TaxID=36822 RepID=A0ABT4MX91_GORRU|nr:zinc-binding dehydrogenase [Gordonia rubripertincta]MCZ4551439.1 zinc-binding dehydrogenase [Gordonia rubripertincta]
MRKAVAREITTDNLASSVTVIDSPVPDERAGWTLVTVKAASLNQHDLWSIRGVGTVADNFPLGLCSDVAGLTPDGTPVVVHSLVADPGAPGGELLDPRRKMLAEATGGGAANYVLVPNRNLVEKPESLSFEQAAGIPTAWMTAYRMLFVAGGAKPGDTVLVQGAGGGVSSAAITLAATAGLRVWVTTRDEGRAKKAETIGASRTFEPGSRLPARVDLVLDTVGTATWDHSMKSVKPGGTVVVSGATTGGAVTVDLNRIFLPHIRIQGSSLGTLADLRAVISFCAVKGIAPVIDSTYPLEKASDAVARIESGQAFGKVVIAP